MRRNQRFFNNVLIYIGLVALAFVVWDDYHKRTSAEREAITSLFPTTLTAFSIERPAQSDMQFLRALHDDGSHGPWRMLQPVNAPADSDRIDAVLSLLRARSPVKRNSDDIAPQSIGLDERSVMFRTPGWEIQFGAIDPLGEWQWIRSNGQVGKIDPSYSELLRADSGGFVSRVLLPQHTNRVQLGSTILPIAPWQRYQADAIQRASTGDALSLSMRVGDEEQVFALRQLAGDYALQPPGADYEFLLSAETARALGLAQ